LKLISVLVVISLSLVPGYTQDGSDLESEKIAIEKTVRNYVDGWYEGSRERMDKALHPALIKRGVRRSKTGKLFLQPLGKSAMLEYTAMGAGKRKDGSMPQNQVMVMDVTGDIAMAKSISPDFIDLLHLVKLEGEWKIIHVIWQPHSVKKK